MLSKRAQLLNLVIDFNRLHSSIHVFFGDTTKGRYIINGERSIVMLSVMHTLDIYINVYICVGSVHN